MTTMVGPIQDLAVARAGSRHPVKQRPEFDFIPLLSRLATDEVERGQVFLQSLQLSTVNTILSFLHTVLLMYLRRCT